MEENKKKAYSEIVEILKLIEDEEKLSKIPFEVIQMFKNNSDPEYKPDCNLCHSSYSRRQTVAVPSDSHSSPYSYWMDHKSSK